MERKPLVSWGLRRAILFLGTVLSVLGACGPPEETPAVNHCRDSVGDCLWLLEVAPQLGAAIVRGNNDTMKCTMEYKLVSATSATANLIVYDSQMWGRPLPGSTQGEASVKGGVGRFVISSTFAVTSPTVTAIRAFLPVWASGFTIPVQSWDIGPWPVQ